MATALDIRHDSLHTFLAWEERQPMRYERIGGVVRMVTGGTIDHNRITLNVANALRRRFSDGHCEAFVDDVKVVSPAGNVMYPDVVVGCGGIPGKATALEQPVVIVEVLSESTAQLDHTRKRWASWTIPSLHHYMLVDQDEAGVEVTSPDADGTWRSVVLRNLDDRLRLPSLHLEIGLDEVFARVAFGAPDAAPTDRGGAPVAGEPGEPVDP